VADKVYLRRCATENLDALRVLDLYAGENVLWSHFETERYYGVEIVKGKGKNLHADCKRLIESLDLSGFNVIDCDSYGIPFEVILKIFNNKTLQKGTVIIYTAISNKMSGISRECLKMYNLERMYKKAATLISAKAHELFYAMLEKYGVRVVYCYQIFGSFEKHYGYFTVD
jgi:hypothetical protein